MPGEIVTISPPLAKIYRVARRGGDPFAPPPWEMAGEDDEPLKTQLMGMLNRLDPRIGGIPADWRLRRLIASTVLDPELRFVDLAALLTHQYLRQAMASDLAQLSLQDLDFSTVSGPQRVLTQRCARHIYDLRDDLGAGVFAGVRYLSRLNPNWECWAIFADRIVHSPGLPATITPDNPDLLEVCRLFNLNVETVGGRPLS